MSELARVLIVGLAAWRVANLVGWEQGPYGVLARFRRWVAPADGSDVSRGLAGFRDELATGMLCVWCATVWLAPVMWLLWDVARVIPLIMAAAAVAVLAEGVGHGSSVDGH